LAKVGIQQQQGKWATAAVFVDYDRDGLLDLLIGHYVDWDPSKEAQLDCTYGTPHKDYCAVKHFAGQGLTLYRNLGDGRFEDVTAGLKGEASVAHTPSIPSVAEDELATKRDAIARYEVGHVYELAWQHGWRHNWGLRCSHC
jgi:hypothetical protein